jgi:hypothetical protein
VRRADAELSVLCVLVVLVTFVVMMIMVMLGVIMVVAGYEIGFNQEVAVAYMPYTVHLVKIWV